MSNVKSDYFPLVVTHEVHNAFPVPRVGYTNLCVWSEKCEEHSSLQLRRCVVLQVASYFVHQQVARSFGLRPRR